MQVSLNWLKEYVPIDLDPGALAELLTMSGSEVDSISETGREYEGVVVGRISSVTPHPNADKLSLCTVDGGGAVYSIVCGAGNIKPGDRVPLALAGTTLPGGGTIKKTKIRGERSEGMLCSQAELSLGGDASGIMILSPTVQVGLPLADAIGLRDTVFEISLTPNRPDCMSIIGLAREIAALTRQDLQPPSSRFEERGEAAFNFASVTVEDPERCPRYCARVVSRVTVGPSPLWMARRLESCGVRSINNVVDVTNYVLLEMGQPLHAFDLELLDRQRIVVKRTVPGSSFTTLDGRERAVPEGSLMICDGSKAVALAGIMGGLNTEVSAGTTRILLESAYFTPSGILRTSKEMGLRTESSQRFERGVDPEGVPRALDRAAKLMEELAGGMVHPGRIDTASGPVSEPPVITLTTTRTNAVLGTDLTRDEIVQALEALTFTVDDRDGETIAVTPPSFRVDIREGIDLVEEVARLHGYDRVTASLPPVAGAPPVRDRAALSAKKTMELLVQQGYHQIVTYSFISPQDLEKLRLDSRDQRLQPIALLNPLTEDQSVMRTTLIPGLLNTVRKNIFQNSTSLKLFESGPVFMPQETERLPREVQLLAGVATGLYREESWDTERREVDFFDLKGCVETLLRHLRVREFSFTPSHRDPFLHPGRALELLVGGEKVGILGAVHRGVLEDFDISQTAYVFELSLSLLLSSCPERIVFRPLPKYPSVYRDLALVVDDTISAQTVYDALQRHKNKFIEKIKVFDYYTGKPLAAGKKSLAYRLTYQAYDHTLTDREVNALHEQLIERLNQELGAVLRE